jgi:autotransporter-associated beta strand protein
MMNRQIDGIGMTSVRSRLRALHLAAGAAVALSALAGSALGQTYTWIGPASSDWDIAANWQGGIAPSGPGSATTALIFNAGNAGTAITSNNDLTTGFQVNSITFNTFCNPAFTVTAGQDPNIQMAGTNATITLSGSNISDNLIAPHTSPTVNAGLQLASDLTILGTGTGGLKITAPISETGGAHSITISGGSKVPGLRMVTLVTGNSFTGGLTLDGGTVASFFGTTQSDSTYGAPGSSLTVTASGGTMALTANGGLHSSLGAIHINGDLLLLGTYDTKLGLVTSVSGVGSPTTDPSTTAVLTGSGTLFNNLCGADGTCTLTICSDSSGFTGPVVIDQSQLPQFGTSPAGQIQLDAISGQGAPYKNGSLHGVPSFDVRAGGALILNNNSTDSYQNGDRIGDSTPVRLRNGKFTLNGPALANTTTNGHNYAPQNLTEVIGAVSFAGNSYVAATPSSGTSVITTLQPFSLTRLERGTLVIADFPNAGQSTTPTMGDGSTPNRARIILTNPLSPSEFVGGGGAAGSQNISILPYAVAESSAAMQTPGFVTYGAADGFRQLQPGEYANSVTAGTNVNLAGTTANTLSVTINSLFLSSNALNSTQGSLTGNGTLTITSGAVLTSAVNAGGSIIQNNLAFGSAEAVITVPTTGLNLSGSLTGTNGLTLTAADAGNQNVFLNATGDNSGLTGQLTLNGGFLQFNSANGPLGTGTIITNGSVATASGKAAGLAYAGTSPVTVSRPINVNTGFMNFVLKDLNFSNGAQPTIANLTISGAISGVGGVNYQAQTISGTPGQIYVTNTGNTYTGVTRINSGTVHVAGEGSLGSGGAIELAGGTLMLEGDLSNSRLVNISTFAFVGTPTINTNGHNATLSGPVTDFWVGGAAPHGGFGHSQAGLIKTGLGTLNFTNPVNTLNGAVTVNGGTLLINGTLGASASNALTVNSGGTLGGSGTIYRNVTANSGATVSPGNSPGVLTVAGNLSMAAGSTLRMELNGAAAGTGYDQVVVNSASTSGNAVVLAGGLTLSLGFAPAANSKFWLINNATTLGTSGAFTGLPEGSTVSLGTVGGITFSGTISYAGNFDTGMADGSGNDVVIYGIDGCGSADFNCDGDVGTDADIESFFACLAGNCPAAPCLSNADFNGDGDVGTDSDIEAFFRVLGGGSC